MPDWVAMAQREVTSPGFNDPRYRELVEALKARRLELKLTQQAVAKRLGVHFQFVSRVELGERRLDVVEFADYVRALGLKPSEVIAAIPGTEDDNVR
jgi:transcriptional regulator with XRE-family HTH domain